MSDFEKAHEVFEEDDRQSLPLTYGFIYRFPKAYKRSSAFFYGVEVAAYNSKSCFPTGFHKPISKSIDLNALKDGD